LDLSYNDIIYNEAAFRKLKVAVRSSSLMTLDLSGNEIGVQGFKDVASALNQ
jgi:hypothetical protein